MIKNARAGHRPIKVGPLNPPLGSPSSTSSSPLPVSHATDLGEPPSVPLIVPLPTNSWCENLFLGPSSSLENNHVFQVPYIIDLAGIIQGPRTHPTRVQANDRAVMMTYEPLNGVSLGAVEQFEPQHQVVDYPSMARLAIVLQWDSDTRLLNGGRGGPAMRSPIVRGSPYTTMEYVSATPRIFVQRALSGNPIIDNGDTKTLVCGSGSGMFSKKPILVKKEIQFTLALNDMTWVVYVSEPTEFTCSNYDIVPPSFNGPPGVLPPVSNEYSYFDLRATRPLKKGVVRLALANNCTIGTNPQYCTDKKPRDNSEYVQLLRQYSEVYPTGDADIRFTFPVESEEEEELRLNFDWAQTSMSSFRQAEDPDDDFAYVTPTTDAPSASNSPSVPTRSMDMLMYGIPHHQERLLPTAEITHLKVHKSGCTPTLHGSACPVVANGWSQLEHLHRVSFYARSPPPARDGFRYC